MTTPQERMRSLRWGSELLAAIEQDLQLDAELVVEAGRLAKSYPGGAALAAALQAPAVPLPSNFATIIDGPWHLFQKVRMSDAVPDELRQHALYTLRHFPLPGTASSIADAAAVGRIGDWLAAEAGSFQP